MIVRVSHTTTYDYELPQRGGLEVLRLTPREYDGQHVRSWRIEVEPAAKLREWEDHFANRCHTADLTATFERLSIFVEGEVDVADTAGVVRGALEPFPPQFYLRDTSFTPIDGDLARFAKDLGEVDSPLPWLHRLMELIPSVLTFDRGVAETQQSASEAIALGRGVCRDFAHVFIAAARRWGVPARYVSGYLAGPDQDPLQAGHAWAEAFVPELGWVGFDATNAQCPTDAYVRVAIGLDSLGAAPIRGSRQGGGGESLNVRLRVDAASQRQS